MAETATVSKCTLTWAQRRAVSIDTINRTPDIVAEHTSQGATLDSTFLSEQMKALPELSTTQTEARKASRVEVINSDSFTLARRLIDEDTENATGKVAVLNLASDRYPGGGWDTTLSKTQEEALCYSSTLFRTLLPSYYPWPNRGPKSVAGVYSPGVVIFKDDLDHDCVDLPTTDRRIVSVITVAAPCAPPLTPDKQLFMLERDLRDLREKIRLVYRMAAWDGRTILVLGAMGCGAYACPPRLVASEMRDILLEPEFKARFTKIVFAVYSVPGNGERNFSVFRDVFQDVEV
ncbi:hypothetical protein D9757_010490 [Collybiopsis confluens]|uniref:Microbial-type PARG catalytic domain-containing protein n=1 Tax=Collybiopsis confluens TaxID=2823264 RepID=A0A8H5LXC3_9AGAR|nr:hypothetical protein D9757_010490 [Collybiopsis confluens]